MRDSIVMCRHTCRISVVFINACVCTSETTSWIKMNNVPHTGAIYLMLQWSEIWPTGHSHGSQDLYCVPMANWIFLP